MVTINSSPSLVNCIQQIIMLAELAVIQVLDNVEIRQPSALKPCGSEPAREGVGNSNM